MDRPSQSTLTIFLEISCERAIRLIADFLQPNIRLALAEASAEERCPDLIITDVGLEESSGVDAVRRICRERPIAVIFMTGDVELTQDEIGGAVLLSKPFTSTALKAIIRTAQQSSRIETKRL